MRLPNAPSLPRVPRLASGLSGGLTSIASLAAFLRERLARHGEAQQLAVVVISAAAPFAPTSYARARLLRQMHASGLLSAHETEQAEQLLGVAQ
jgi:hypothetical protein